MLARPNCGFYAIDGRPCRIYGVAENEAGCVYHVALCLARPDEITIVSQWDDPFLGRRRSVPHAERLDRVHLSGS
jgi:hypothetical protein